MENNIPNDWNESRFRPFFSDNEEDENWQFNVILENDNHQLEIEMLDSSPDYQYSEPELVNFSISPDNQHSEAGKETPGNLPENQYPEAAPENSTCGGSSSSSSSQPSALINSLEGASSSQSEFSSGYSGNAITALPRPAEELKSLLSNVFKEEGVDISMMRHVELLYLSKKTWHLYQKLLVSALDTIEEDLKKQQRWEERLLGALCFLRDAEVSGLPDEEKTARKEKVTNFLNTVFSDLKLNGATKVLPLVTEMKTAINHPIGFSLPPKPEYMD